MSLVELHEISCRRDNITLFDPVSIAVPAGGKVEMSGPNGAGKTTLLRTLAGLFQQYEGTFSCSTHLFQGHRPGLDELLDAVENLQWHASIAGQTVNENEILEALERVGMISRALVPVARLSQGQQRRVAMARWQLSGARVWLLDEPLTALDTDAQELLVSMIQEHCAGGGAAVYATHTPVKLDDKVELRLSPRGDQA